ncbi:MAG: class I SAM-dependent methyltransferase [Proteobacteria bacterium]|nr:class I SAM-dependent methyltransferase [Pseudomonadota bacterium]
MTGSPPSDPARALHETNRRFYDRLWSASRFAAPDRFNTWPTVAALLGAAGGVPRLEIGPGLRPRLPVAGTCVLDISAPALARLRAAGALPALGDAAALPYPDACFGLIAALDVIEHVEDDRAALSELARVARPGAALLLSVPLHPARWTAFDTVVGHRRRYEPAALAALLAAHGFAPARAAAFGMQPRAAWLARLGAWFLANQPARALWWYDRLLMPLALRRQKPLALQPAAMHAPRWGTGWAAEMDEILLLCHRLPAPAPDQETDDARQPA